MYALDRTDPNMKRQGSGRNQAGFTLTELMMAIAVFGLLMAGATGTFSIGVRTWRTSAAGMDASCQASTVLSRIAYGVGDRCGLRAAFAPITAASDDSGWTITYSVPAGTSGTAREEDRLRYDSGTQTIAHQGGSNGVWNVIGKNVLASTISATSADVTVMIRSTAIVGNCGTVNEKTSAITFRNGS